MRNTTRKPRGRGLDFKEVLASQTATEDEKAAAFLSKFMSVVKPYSTFKGYFETHLKTKTFASIKLFYKSLVLEKGWTEKKFVAALMDTMYSGKAVSAVALEVGARLYDDGKLSGSGQRISDTRSTGSK